MSLQAPATLRAATRPPDVAARVRALALACDLDRDVHADVEAIGAEVRDKTVAPKEAEDRLKLLDQVTSHLQAEARLVSSKDIVKVKVDVEHMLSFEQHRVHELARMARRGQWSAAHDKAETDYLQAREVAEKSVREAMAKLTAPVAGEVAERAIVDTEGYAPISTIELRGTSEQAQMQLLALDGNGKVVGQGPHDAALHDIEGVGDIGRQSQIFVITGTPASPTRFRIMRWTGDGFTLDHAGALVQREPNVFGWTGGDVSGGEWIARFRAALDDSNWLVSLGPKYGSAVVSYMPGGFTVSRWVVKPAE
jgi:hypothetical protein